AGDVGLDMPLESEVAAAIGVIDGVGLLAVEPGCVRVRVQAEVLPAALRRPGSRTAVITPAAYYEGSVRGRCPETQRRRAERAAHAGRVVDHPLDRRLESRERVDARDRRERRAVTAVHGHRAVRERTGR